MVDYFLQTPYIPIIHNIQAFVTMNAAKLANAAYTSCIIPIFPSFKLYRLLTLFAKRKTFLFHRRPVKNRFSAHSAASFYTMVATYHLPHGIFRYVADMSRVIRRFCPAVDKNLPHNCRRLTSGYALHFFKEIIDKTAVFGQSK